MAITMTDATYAKRLISVPKSKYKKINELKKHPQFIGEFKNYGSKRSPSWWFETDEDAYEAMARLHLYGSN